MSDTPAGLTREAAERLLDECPLHAAIGLTLEEWEPGRAGFRFQPPALVRSGAAGGVHGGALATALDTAACFAAIARLGHDCSTVDLRTDFVRPAVDTSFVVTGELRRAGRRLAWADATLRTHDERVVAIARGVFTW